MRNILVFKQFNNYQHIPHSQKNDHFLTTTTYNGVNKYAAWVQFGVTRCTKIAYFKVILRIFLVFSKKRQNFVKNDHFLEKIDICRGECVLGRDSGYLVAFRAHVSVKLASQVDGSYKGPINWARIADVFLAR